MFTMRVLISVYDVKLASANTLNHIGINLADNDGIANPKMYSCG